MADTATKPNSKVNPVPDAAPLLQSLQLQNFLSFGPDAQTITLGPLNILIGANGSGKSNLIEAISLLRSCPVSASSRSSLESSVRRGGGADEWIWKGDPMSPAILNAVFKNLDAKEPLQHRIEFTSEQKRFQLSRENIGTANAGPAPEKGQHFYAYGQGNHVVQMGSDNGPRQINKQTIEDNVSILAQRNDPEQYPEISYLIRQYEKIAIYREWQFGRNTPLREAQSVLGRSDRLEEDFSNLYLYLNHLYSRPKTKRLLLEKLRDIYSEVTDISFELYSTSIRILLTEGDYSIPSERLSDGTLRYLCLLAILCDPTPPPLICIEEPELGLHPDILPKIADLLVAASKRTQLIVTTHSDVIVDAMTPTPEAVVVCEKHEGQTELRRLSAENLKVWLDKYRLGELWTMGELGGTRW